MKMEAFNDNELDEIYDFAVQLGKDAGTLLKAAANPELRRSQAADAASAFAEKDNAVDIVTQTDHGD